MTTNAEPNQKKPDRHRGSSLAVGAASLFASSLFRQGIGIVSLGVTARLLTPTDFGIIAYFLVFTTIFEVLQRQVSMALIRLESVTPDHIHTIFTIQFLLGLVGAVIAWFFGPILVFFDLGELSSILPAVAAYSFLIGTRNPKIVTYERDLKFSYAVIEETISRIVYSIAAIVLVWMWPTFWSLIIAGFITTIVHNAYTYVAAPHLPRLSLARWRDSLVFSLWAMGAQMFLVVASKIPLLFIGAQLSLADAGIFRLGSRVTSIATTQFFAPVQRVVYPGLADISRSAGQKERAFVMLNALTLALVLPLAVGAALIAEDTIVYALGEKWRMSAHVIWILAPLKALQALQANVKAASLVDGSVRRLFFRSLLLMVLSAFLMTYGVKYGFYGALVAAALCSVAALLITLLLAKGYGTGGFLDPLLVAWRSFLSCAAMAGVIIGLNALAGTYWPDIHPLIAIILQIAIGIVTYVSLHIALWAMVGRPEGFETLLFALVGRLRRKLKRKEA
ncbi:oligosaccharide flippase family protein (plasmid) [Aliiroseovarius sp. M344]|uniref:oligosaccharide flippase family protein n=1 Tax=Aliiroseovarius sp. M344 TaxID=2867010 RepID=UPI0021AE0838|nr:oligosaccharide flippase family protein [Aliiroseovarius sp. M344]UWQ16063.1 oligosaccharide flippase family protein [Aliiroseovarius sp. M344]